MAEQFVKVASKADIAPGAAKSFEINGRQVAVCHVEDGGFYAISDICTHDNAPLDQGTLWASQIECPRHGARFDVKTGKAMCLPAVLPVATYEVELRGEEIWVSTQATVKGGK